MLTSLFLSFMGAVGLFLIVLSMTLAPRTEGLARIRRLLEAGGGASQEPSAAAESLLGTFRRRGLAAALAQAELPVSAAGFVRTGLLLGLAASLTTFLLSGAVWASLLMGAIALILYVQWLCQRREARRLAYEEALAEVCDRLGVGAQLYGSLKGALSHAAETAPEAASEDFRALAGQIAAGASLQAAFEAVRERRRSAALDLLADTLGVWAGRGAAIPLQEILSPLSATIRETAGERRRMQAELSGVRSQMRLVALAPPLLVGLLRFSSPALSRIYASPGGELIQTAAYLLALGGFLLGSRALAQVNRVFEIEAV